MVYWKITFFVMSTAQKRYFLPVLGGGELPPPSFSIWASLYGQAKTKNEPPPPSIIPSGKPCPPLRVLGCPSPSLFLNKTRTASKNVAFRIECYCVHKKKLIKKARSKPLKWPHLILRTLPILSRPHYNFTQSILQLIDENSRKVRSISVLFASKQKWPNTHQK